jgi:hypothetical protein
MDVNEAIQLVTQYVYDRKGERIQVNNAFIMMNKRQKIMLEQAVKVAVNYYNGKEIKI